MSRLWDRALAQVVVGWRVATLLLCLRCVAHEYRFTTDTWSLSMDTAVRAYVVSVSYVCVVGMDALRFPRDSHQCVVVVCVGVGR